MGSNLADLLTLFLIFTVVLSGCLTPAERTKPPGFDVSENNEELIEEKIDVTLKYPFVAKGTMEFEGNIHNITVYSTGEKTIVKGQFKILNEEWPGKILFTSKKNYLYKPDPSSAIIFSAPYYIVYGFVPLSYLDEPGELGGLVKTLEVDENKFPIKFEVNDNGKKSIVTFTKVEFVENINEKTFELPKDTTFIPFENFTPVTIN